MSWFEGPVVFFFFFFFCVLTHWRGSQGRSPLDSIRRVSATWSVRCCFVPSSTQLLIPPGASQRRSVTSAWRCCWLPQTVYFVIFFSPLHCLCAIVNIFHLDCAVDSESARGCYILNAAAVRFRQKKWTRQIFSERTSGMLLKWAVLQPVDTRASSTTAAIGSGNCGPAQ